MRYFSMFSGIGGFELGITQNLKRGVHSGGETLIEITSGMSDAQRVYSTKGVSKTIKGLGGGQGAKTGLYKIGAKIRRLTPTECERLQGFPDNWTKGISDTQRYKCLGNAVTVNVIKAIMNKIMGDKQ